MSLCRSWLARHAGMMGYMALVIDASRAFRRIHELVNLVEAVVLADPNDESDWIE